MYIMKVLFGFMFWIVGALYLISIDSRFFMVGLLFLLSDIFTED